MNELYYNCQNCPYDSDEGCKYDGPGPCFMRLRKECDRGNKMIDQIRQFIENEKAFTIKIKDSCDTEYYEYYCGRLTALHKVLAFLDGLKDEKTSD